MRTLERSSYSKQAANNLSLSRRPRIEHLATILPHRTQCHKQLIFWEVLTCTLLMAEGSPMSPWNDCNGHVTPPLFGGSFDDWINTEQESLFGNQDDKFGKWLDASDSLNALEDSSSNERSNAQLVAPSEHHLQERPWAGNELENDQNSAQDKFMPDPMVQTLSQITHPRENPAVQNFTSSDPQICIQCCEAGYVNTHVRFPCDPYRVSI